MSENRLPDYLDHIQQMAATDVSSLVGKEAAADTLIGNCTTARPASRSNSS